MYPWVSMEEIPYCSITWKWCKKIPERELEEEDKDLKFISMTVIILYNNGKYVCVCVCHNCM